MVEGAIAGFVFLALLFGVFEFGSTFFDYLTTNSATRNGARVGSTVGNEPLTDYKILQKVKASSTTMSADEIQSIVIYKATSTNHAVPSNCLTTSVSGLCNTYTGADLARPSSDFSCSGASPDRYWCPTSRLVGASADTTPVMGPPDYVGVYVKVEHPTVTKLFASSYSFSSSFVLRLEAQTP